MSALPGSYSNAAWRCTLPVDTAGRLGLALNLPDGTVLRFALDLKSARDIAETIAAYLAEHQAEGRK